MFRAVLTALLLGLLLLAAAGCGVAAMRNEAAPHGVRQKRDEDRVAEIRERDLGKGADKERLEPAK